jgi:hypothetical protein
MAWSTPRTWVSGELVTASIGNAHWRDQFIELAKIGAHRCYAYNSGAQVVASGATDALLMDSEVYDSGTLHSLVSTTNRITVPAAGYYRIFGLSNVTNNNNGEATLHLRKNGSALTPVVRDSFVTAAANFEDQWMKVAAVLLLSASDYVELAGQAAANDFGFATTQLTVEGLTSVV